jgi:tetraacyldisaccharide 4'-kinase
MREMRKLLFPFSLLYGLVTGIRNFLYDNGIFKSVEFNVPVVAIGNLSVGGTGKTPVTEYLIRLLSPTCKVAVLSRGYGRKTDGFILAGNASSAQAIGDEPLQYFLKFPEISVAVDANRARGISRLLSEIKPDVILLDDAFQHRKVKAGFYILLTAFGDLYCDDWLLPAGNLRESKIGAKRVDVIVVTKCPPQLTPGAQDEIRGKLKPEIHQQIFFTSVDYDEHAIGADGKIDVETLRAKHKTLLAGIAKPKPFFDYLRGSRDMLLEFPDHHDFSGKNLALIREKSAGNPIVTTEKDYVRLKGSGLENVYYLPMRARFLGDAGAFDKTIHDHVRKNTANN